MLQRVLQGSLSPDPLSAAACLSKRYQLVPALNLALPSHLHKQYGLVVWRAVG